MADVFLEDFSTWRTLPDAVKSGLPTAAQTNEVPDNPFWHVLVTAIAPLSFPVAHLVAERLGLAAAGPISARRRRWIRVWSAAWLRVNSAATGYQLDWPTVNAIAREFVSRFGVGDRFKTLDGDFHTSDFGTAKYGCAVYSHIAHQEAPAGNIAIFRKFRQALKPGGTFVVNDFVLNDERVGHPFAMMFTSQMLLVTKDGFTYREGDYRSWLSEAGFTSIEMVPTETPATVVLAT